MLLPRQRRLPHLLRHNLRSLPIPPKAFNKGPTQICSVFGPTCDALDTISLAEDLPDLELGDLVYSENIGAYSHASPPFNGFPPATVVHVGSSEGRSKSPGYTWASTHAWLTPTPTTRCFPPRHLEEEQLMPKCPHHPLNPARPRLRSAGGNSCTRARQS